MSMDNAVGSPRAQSSLSSRLGKALPGLVMVVVTVLIGASLSAAPFDQAARDIVISPLLCMVVVVFLLTSTRAHQTPTGHETRRTPVRRLVRALYWFIAGQLVLTAVFGMDLFPGAWYAVPSEILLGLGGASCLGESWRLLTERHAQAPG